MSAPVSSQIDVFISYARPDREAARALAALLEARGFAVWWDWNLIGGRDYRAEIIDALERARKVIVLWSAESIASGFVLDEAGHARERGKLVPIVIDAASPPFGFGNLHTLTSHDFERDIEAIVAALEDRAQAPMAPEPGRAARPRRDRRWVLAGGAAALAAGAGGGAWWWTQAGGPAAVPTDARVNRIALVIGINDYVNVQDLQNAQNDAEAVSSALAGRGFKVIKLLDPRTDAAGIRDAIGRFKTLLSLGGVGLFYYAGQAAYIRGRDYILPRDARSIQSEDDLIAAGIDIADVTGPIEGFLAGTPGDTRLAGVCIGTEEACATGAGTVPAPAPPVQTDTAAIALPGAVTNPVRDNGVFMVYSASAGEVALDGATGQDRNSPFATALLAQIGDGDGELTALSRRVRSQVKEITGGVQNPVMEDRAEAPFFFNRPDADPAEGVLRIVMLDSCRDNPFALGRSR